MIIKCLFGNFNKNKKINLIILLLYYIIDYRINLSYVAENIIYFFFKFG